MGRRGGGWGLPGWILGLDVSLRRNGQRSLAERQWKDLNLLLPQSFQGISSVPSSRGHHGPKRTYKVSGTGWEASLWFIKAAPTGGEAKEKHLAGAPPI